MPKIFPTPFRTREWIVTPLALACAISALLLVNSAGLGAGGALFLSVIFGTLLFVTIGGRHRVFFTGLFTGTTSVGLVVWSMVDTVFVRHDSLATEYLLLPVSLALFYVLVPIGFAWMVTLMISQLASSSRKE